jgi:hypothetical protein
MLTCFQINRVTRYAAAGIVIIACSFFIFNCSARHRAIAGDPTAVAKINDQSDLAEVAIEAPYNSIQLAAVEKLTYQHLLARVAALSKSLATRHAAFAKITDENATADMLNNYFYSYLAKYQDSDLISAALAKITSPSILANLARNTKYSAPGLAAVDKLTDQSELANVFLYAALREVSLAAKKKVTDTRLLLPPGPLYCCIPLRNNDVSAEVSIAIKITPPAFSEFWEISLDDDSIMLCPSYIAVTPDIWRSPCSSGYSRGLYVTAESCIGEGAFALIRSMPNTTEGRCVAFVGRQSLPGIR